MEHVGATEDFARVLAEIREELSTVDTDIGRHVDGEKCDFELAVVWRCATCGREQWRFVEEGA